MMRTISKICAPLNVSAALDRITAAASCRSFVLSVAEKSADLDGWWPEVGPRERRVDRYGEFGFVKHSTHRIEQVFSPQEWVAARRG